jgi:periplasmic protein TonB
VQEVVSAILHDRAKQADGLHRMLLLSIGAHILLLTAGLLVPDGWFTRQQVEEPNQMVISLGGVAGPETGGMTTIADRAVQSIAKPDAPKVVETPPAAKRPEMVEPDRIAKSTPTPTVAKPADSKTRTPTAGDEIKTGSARVKTGGAAIPFGGLASGGGGDGGVKLDTANFCCPQYVAQMIQLIRQNWTPNQGASGQSVVKFTIRKDGVLTNIELERSSGQALLDLEARRAVHKTTQLPPLPREFPESHLTVHLTFEFHR